MIAKYIPYTCKNKNPMVDGARVVVTLADEGEWYAGTVIKSRKMWTKLDAYCGYDMIADESNISDWKYI